MLKDIRLPNVKGLQAPKCQDIRLQCIKGHEISTNQRTLGSQVSKDVRHPSVSALGSQMPHSRRLQLSLCLKLQHGWKVPGARVYKVSLWKTRD